MKKKRKLIGVILSDVTAEYREYLLKGIISQAKEYDYNIAVFATFVRAEGTQKHKQGEANIFELPNYDKFDGIIFAPDTIRIEGLADKIEEDLKKKCKCPVICPDMSTASFPTVSRDDREDMRLMVNHFIKVHGFTSINCLTGPKNSVDARKRLQGYMDALTENGIAVDTSRIYYGDFMKSSAVLYVDDLMSGTIPFPEAIVCGNDYMAIGVCDALREYGIRVPEDVSISGYDNVKAARQNTPIITTIKMPVEEVGSRAVKAIHESIMGIKDKDESVLQGQLIIGKSCGCSGSQIRTKDKAEREINYQIELEQEKEDFFAMSFMGENLIGVSNLDDFFENLRNHINLLKDYNDFYLCLCEDWDAACQTDNPEEYLRNGYTKNMNEVIAFKDRIQILNKSMFPVEDMLPDLYEENDEMKTYFFVPIHFKDRCFGYAVLTYQNQFKLYDFTYRSWIQNINHSLEFVRVQNNLRWCYDRLDEVAVTDMLTGIYNRRGLERYAGNIFKTCKEKRKPFILMLGDLDNLKKINDGFGHTEGDRAIVAVAKAFHSIHSQNPIQARIGGDEFVLVFEGEYTEEQIEIFKEEIHNYLKEYNNVTNYPYLVSASIGIYYGIPSDNMTMNDCIEMADRLMYIEKHKKA